MVSANAQERKRVKPIIEEMSAWLYIGGCYPWRRGNRFAIKNPDDSVHGIPVTNMSAEDFLEAVARFGLEDIEIEIMKRENGEQSCRIVDSRIPLNWFFAEK